MLTFTIMNNPLIKDPLHYCSTSCLSSVTQNQRSIENQNQGNSMTTMKQLNIAVAVAVTVLIGMLGSSEAQLQMNFYAKSCPNAEKIISDHIQNHIHNGPSLAAPLIRMHFHDCFVRVFI